MTMKMEERTLSRRLYCLLAEGGHGRSASYHTYKDLKCAYPRRVQPHKAPGGALPCCWGTCCTAPTPLRDFRDEKEEKRRGAHEKDKLLLWQERGNIDLEGQC